MWSTLRWLPPFVAEASSGHWPSHLSQDMSQYLAQDRPIPQLMVPAQQVTDKGHGYTETQAMGHRRAGMTAGTRLALLE